MDLSREISVIKNGGELAEGGAEPAALKANTVAPARGLECREEFVYGDGGVAEDTTEGAEGNFRMERDGHGNTLRVVCVAKADMAALLTDGYVTKLSKCANEVCARDNGQLRAHRVTTTLPIKTFSVSGSSSPRLSMSSRQRSMASRILARASETVLPWE